ncbi:ATP-binding protein [Stetteria hydrogenophila]
MARCRVCGAPAVICYPESRLCLCRDHFLEHFESKVERTLRRYRLVREGGFVLAAVSGGKDSAALLGVLSRLSSRLGFRLAAVHIDLGIGEYSRRSREAAVRLARELGVPLAVIDLRELLGLGVPELAVKARRPPCSVCGLVKRYLTNAAGVEACADAVALGHNADDLAVYALKSFLTQDLEAIPKLGPGTESIPGLAVGRIRPLYLASEKESFLYAYLSGLPFNHEECPHASRRLLEFILKEHLASLESRRPGLRTQFLAKLAKRLNDYPKPEGEPRPCRHCGLLSWGECSFCRLTRRILGEPMGPKAREYVRAKLEEAGAVMCRG